ncbi:MAG: alpha/beta fold hydrolase [Demequina sp.]
MTKRTPYLYRSDAAREDYLYRHGPLTFRVLADVPRRASSSPTYVLVHGIGMSHRYLSRLHALLAKTSPTFSIDVPGHAGLPKPGMDVDVATMARGLVGAIASLDVGPVVLVGHSMGAQWTTAAALTNPELVDRLVLMGPVADSGHRTLAAQTAALARDSLGETAGANAIVFTDYLRCGMPWYLAQARHLLTYAIEDEVAQLTMPTLILRGAQDPIAGSKWCRRLASLAPASGLVEVPGQHHVVQHSAPEAVATAIQTFARGQDTSSGPTP